ncbi:polysaccharide deacetylase family protein [Metabacillus litoralis]|jgi:peptidoglycan-N-acetylglucosamine deacetylase|uniref:polysaccharide deacetylase family protein n=1 Tax=Metabacillus litoralis TaxID=152268 RepID=UPI00203B2082|nr:polysaccharide deacetylase family protein [Metabacillus litoralis]MCM3654558.1 polysaccharide deacetylase family protein [Metabacillus litoralis]
MKAKVLLFLLIASLLIGSLVVHANEISSKDVKEESQLKQERKNLQDKLPQLQGGTEKSERNRQQPLTLYDLQKKYPETVILHGPSTAKKIALTFDDGPDPRFTGQVLDVLKQYNVPATFFLMGSRANAYPDIVKRINKEGHIIGNHSYWHPNLVEEADIGTLEREISQTEETLNKIIGYRPKLFRPPYGFLYEALVEYLAKKEFNVILWTVDSLDWQEDPPEKIANKVIKETHPGAIILMHDGGEWDADRTNTIESLRQIIPELQKEGYEFVTVPQLVNIPYKK